MMKKTFFALCLTAVAMPVLAMGNLEKARSLESSAIRHEAAGRHTSAMKRLRGSIMLDRESAEAYLLGSRVRLKMGDEVRSEGNLYYGVMRSLRNGSYAQLSEKVRTDSEYTEILSTERNRLILDLFDSVEDGVITVEEAKEALRNPDRLKDAVKSAPMEKIAVDESAIEPSVAIEKESEEIVTENQKSRLNWGFLPLERR